jgi:hypothetical protein
MLYDIYSVPGLTEFLPYRMGNIGNRGHTDLDLYAAISFLVVALLVNPSLKLGEQRSEDTCAAWHCWAPFVPDVPLWAQEERRRENTLMSGYRGARIHVRGESLINHTSLIYFPISLNELS